MEETKLNFHLEALIRGEDSVTDFEGPLSLILELLRKNKIEIRDIRISDILDQYLEYLDRMQAMDLEVTSEFVQMASYLLLIKSKMLLSGDKAEVSELEELISSLEKLQAKDRFDSLRTLVPELNERAGRGLLFFTKPPSPLPKENGEMDYNLSETDLLSALLFACSRKARNEAPERPVMPVYPKRVLFSVREKSRQLIRRLRTGPGLLEDIFRDCATRTEKVAAFLSVLELCSLGSVSIASAEGGYMIRLTGDVSDEILGNITEE